MAMVRPRETEETEISSGHYSGILETSLQHSFSVIHYSKDMVKDGLGLIYVSLKLLQGKK